MECWFKSNSIPHLPGVSTTECPGCGLAVNSGQAMRCRANGPKVRGLGDVVQRALKATGVAAVVKAIIPNCGCSARQARLNAMFPLAADPPTEPEHHE